jgi:putative membrane protein
MVMKNEISQVQTTKGDTKTVKVKDANDMAVERTMMAADRSMMAWVRTGLSLISFGFTIYKFLDIQRQQLIEAGKIVPTISGPKVFGLVMIGMGILALLMGTVEYVATTRSYRMQSGLRRPMYSLYLSAIITIIGIILFVGIIFQFNGIS